MRKAFALLLVLVLIAAAGYMGLHCFVSGQKEAVTWQEELLYGDSSLLENVTVRTENHLRGHLLWETTGTLGGELNPVTEFTFSSEYMSSETEIVFTGICMDATEDFLADLAFGYSDVPEYAAEKYAELIAYCRSCYESVAIGEEKTFHVDLTEYMDYYSLSGSFDLPDCDWAFFSEFGSKVSTNVRMRVADSVTQALNEFFRIPILGEYRAEFTINRTERGSSFGGGAYDQAIYRPWFYSVYADGEIYLVFNAVAPNGDVADTSLIPGGFGIYRVNVTPDGQGSVTAESPIAEMVCPLDPSEKIRDLMLSDDRRHLYIHTQEGSDIYRTVVEIETMTCLQKIKLMEDEEDFYFGHYYYDDFLVILKLGIDNTRSEENSVTVFAEDDQGLYSHIFTVPMNAGELDVNDGLQIFSTADFHMDFRGDTLYVIDNYLSALGDHRYSRSSPDFYVLSYTPRGLGYAGHYRVNLSDVNYDPNNDECAIKPWYDAPVTITAE